MDNSDLGKRMKNYEFVSKNILMKRTPVAIRIDGRAFSTFTKGMQKPFDPVLIKSMQETMKYLCENIQGCVLGYTQSDEITLILIDYKKLNTSAWFDNKVQKICSISASIATMAFNKFFWNNVSEKDNNFCTRDLQSEKIIEYLTVLTKAREKGAVFDARCFNIPKEEVANLIYWRQLDAIRNSIESVGQANFSNKELQNKTCEMIKDMLLSERKINWDDLPTTYKRGSCCVKNKYTVGENESQIRDINKPETAWIIDNDIPIFKNEGRQYIEILVDI